MAFAFYRKPLLLSAKTLKTLVENFSSYTKPLEITENEDELFHKCCRATDLITEAINQINTCKESLQGQYDKMQALYENTTAKSEKKDMFSELQEIENESKFQEVIASANETIFMLEIRLTEARHDKLRLSQKLGLTIPSAKTRYSRKPSNIASDGTEQRVDSRDNNSEHSIDDEFLSDDESEQSQRLHKAISPPKIKLPKFYGVEEEFTEFWAVFETLVHSNKSLSTVEKMLLLKESLRGNSENAIKGIQLVPQNYPWMVNSLKKKYGNKPINRSRIVQRLVNLKPASNTAENCVYVLDKVKMLVNLMVSAGLDIRSTEDPMWTEAILKKFPNSIVKKVLLEAQEKAEVTIDDLIADLEKQINAKVYVDSRLNAHRPHNTSETRAAPENSQSARKEKSCAFCKASNHLSIACKTVTDIQRRRDCVREQNLCWKCYSSQHKSFECKKPNCPNCDQAHHSSLCTKTGGGHMERQSSSRSNPHSTNDYNRNRVRFNTQRSEGTSRFRRPYVEHELQNGTRNDGISANMSVPKESIPTNNLERHQVVLMTAEGNIWNHKQQKFQKALFFFDTGAQKTIIREQLADELGLPQQHSELCVMSGIGGHIEQFRSNFVPLKLSTTYGKLIDLTIQTKPVLTNGFSSVNLSDCDKDFLEENGICLSNTRVRGEHQIPEILVGLDYYYALVLDNGVKGKLPSGLHIINTVFGPTVQGRGTLRPTTENPTSISMGLTLVSEGKESEILQNIFELDGLGISSDEYKRNESVVDYLEKYSRTISFKDGIVTAPFPLKDNIIDLANNYPVALRRIASLLAQLKTNKEQRHWYCKIIDDYLSADIIEVVNEPVKESVGTYYMPHSGVWRPHKPKPLRIVFDASSKQRNQLSLNEVTHKGESFVNKIHDILMACKLSKIILICDIEAAFTQIRLFESHRDLCRFLWIKNLDLPPDRNNILEFRFKRLPFGVTSSPSILNMAILSYLDKVNSPLAKEISRNLYVDNILLLADTVEEAVEKYKESKQLFAAIGMNLREYVSNSTAVNEQIADIDKTPTGTIKLLGVEYNTESDAFTVRTKLQDRTSLTKRDVVSQINSIYDPMGFAGPLTIRLKCIMREVYNSPIGWKDPIYREHLEKWIAICKEIGNVAIAIPRLSVPCQNVQEIPKLWIFSDASQAAIAACAYFQLAKQKAVSQLVCGKTKLTPKKSPQTIPRLELLSILIGVRLASSILEASSCPINELYIVSDSEIALYWLNTTRTLPLFVTNQRDRIRKLVSAITAKGVKVTTYHVESAFNPADVGTRGSTATQILNSSWIQGPQWLNSEENSWPLKQLGHQSDGNCQSRSLPEVEPTPILENRLSHFSNASSINTNTATALRDLPSLIDLERFSRVNRALRALAYVGKTLKEWVKQTNKNSNTMITLRRVSEFTNSSEISAEDIAVSEKFLIAETHRNIDVVELQRRYPEKKFFKDDQGIIRYESRLQNADIPFDTKSPMLLPNDSDLCRLVVNHIHKQYAHCGAEQTLSIVRQRFWIPKPSATISKYVRKCITCKKVNGLPYGAPLMPPLPGDRVAVTKPFQNTACDFLGPFESPSKQKMYVCLYTSLTTRAVHLEVVENMSTGAFLNCLVRFISRRGVPQLIRSDCGTNFKLGQKILDSLYENDEITGESVMSYCANQRIRWLFNPPSAPWMGGVWERLVRTVKQAFQKTIGRRKLSFAQMCTVIAQIEAIVNTRPLTKVSLTEINQVPLRPVDFLQSSLRFSLPANRAIDDSVDPSFDMETIQTVKQAKEAYEFAENLAAKFWERWSKDYLTYLRDNQKRVLPQPRHTSISNAPLVGEIVLVEQDLLPRGSWMYGKVVQLIESADKQVRSVKLLMPNGNTWHRPLNKVYPLELRSYPDETPEQVSSEPEEQHSSNPQQRPSRNSKTVAYDVIREFVRDLRDDDQPTSLMMVAKPSKPLFGKIQTAIMLLAIASSAVTASPTVGAVKCLKGFVEIIPPKSNFELCFDNHCRSFQNVSESLHYKLEHSPHPDKTRIRLKVATQNQTATADKLCDPPDFCDNMGYFLSKSLVGNPHCWPTGAITSAVIIAYTLLLVLLAILTLMMKKFNVGGKLGSSVRNATNLSNFEVMALNRRLTPIAVLALTLLVNVSIACQHAYLRHTVDLTCESKGVCRYAYNREVLFNRVHKELCILIRHNNRTVGTVKISRKPLLLSCSKVSLFFTRDTTPRVYQKTRCPQAGSCVDNKCATIAPDEIVPELEASAKYPGYSTCTSSCSGLVCGCFLPLPACAFFRLAHVPRSENVFEVVRCQDWKVAVPIDVEVTMYNTEKNYSALLTPYISKKIGDFNMNVISVQDPHSQLLNSRYAISDTEAFVVPDQYRLPVKCETHEMAFSHFRNCTNDMVCACEGAKTHSTCNCPSDSIQTIRLDPSNRLPVTTPSLEIAMVSESLIASSDVGEFTLTVESEMLIDSTELVIDQPCMVEIHSIRGCYDCMAGTRVNISCFSPSHTWLTIDCDSQAFAVECDANDKQSEIVLEFSSAVVQQKCTTVCNRKSVNIELSATLVYHPSVGKRSVFEIQDPPVASIVTDWFADLSFPDLTPLIVTMRKHWKVALVAITTATIITALTYCFGPLLLLALLKFALLTVKWIATVLAKSLMCICSSIYKECMRA